MHRIFCRPLPGPGETCRLNPREEEHLFKVFRARPGEEVRLLDGAGKIAGAEVLPDRSLKILDITGHPRPAGRLRLCCALPKRQKIDQLLTQAAELGADTIQPLRCRYSVAEGGARERWDYHLVEACKQSGNPYLPEILPERTPAEAAEAAVRDGFTLAYGAMIPESGVEFPAADYAFFVGPEGGFSAEEVKGLREKGAKALNLGPYILRLETAAACGLAVLRRFLLLAAAVILLAGCTDSKSIYNNPLMKKAAELREQGEPELARKFYRQAIARYPVNPEPYLQLAKLCGEELNDYQEAIFCYRCFLQLAPATHSFRENAEKIIRYLEEKAGEKLTAEKLAPLQEELTAVKAENAKLKQALKVQQQQLLKAKQELIRRRSAGGERRRQ